MTAAGQVIAGGRTNYWLDTHALTEQQAGDGVAGATSP
jgi:hypothetical protein